MMNYADGMLFGWQFWLAVIATIGAFWYIMRYSRKHEATKTPRPPKSAASKPYSTQRPPAGRRP
jgi:hypothetical protein